jgi:hypothetical protein
MFFWIYDIPTWQLASLFAAVFVGVTWAGILLLSPFIKIWLKGQEIVHAEAFRQFNDMVVMRRQRIQSIGTGIPGVLWYVVAVGAVINTLLILCFRIRFDIHLFIGGMLSFFVGVVVFLVAAMDHPFRGDVSVGPDAFQLIYTSIMAR